jgi:hypothetical protein
VRAQRQKRIGLVPFFHQPPERNTAPTPP